MDIKEIAPKLTQKLAIAINDDEAVEFAEALIESYKAELLKEVVEPVAYMTTDEEGSASMLFFDRAEALKYSGDDEPVNLFAESQLQAAQEEWNQCSGLLDDSIRSIEMLEDQLATAEQRVAEACACTCENARVRVEIDSAMHAADAIRSGEWRKFLKEGE